MARDAVRKFIPNNFYCYQGNYSWSKLKLTKLKSTSLTLYHLHLPDNNEKKNTGMIIKPYARVHNLFSNPLQKFPWPKKISLKVPWVFQVLPDFQLVMLFPKLKTYNVFSTFDLQKMTKKALITQLVALSSFQTYIDFQIFLKYSINMSIDYW